MRTTRHVRWAILAALLVASGCAPKPKVETGPAPKTAKNTTFAADFVAPPLPPAITFSRAKTVKVTDTGAVADEATLCTDAIKKAIDEVGAAGGGIVVFPKADKAYLTGPIHLMSNITLQIDEGATIKFATDPKLYPLVKTRYEDVDIMNYSPLIYAYQCENIRIMGKGTIDGQGPVWWAWARNPTGAANGGRVRGPPAIHQRRHRLEVRLWCAAAVPGRVWAARPTLGGSWLSTRTTARGSTRWKSASSARRIQGTGPA